MRLKPERILSMPKLAWVAVFADGDDTITVYHGPMVETTPDWCVEAVWAGEFTEGDFDRTDLVFGSGVRCRGDHVVFVSSGSTLDRLWYCHDAGRSYAANSLPALLAVAGLSLRDDYLQYAEDIKTICGGLKEYKRRFPTTSADVCIIYFNNLVYGGDGLTEVDKPDSAPRFATFDDYHAFLLASADCLGANMNSPGRTYEVRPLATISTGYDSPASAVIAKRAGCDQAVTFRRSTSLWRGTDSGEKIARCTGLTCRSYPRAAKHYPLEESIWAVVGRPGVLNWTAFEYPEPLCVLFTGCYGDKVWACVCKNLTDPFVMGAVALLGIGEFRLFKGVFHCPVPFFGMRHWPEIEDISFSKEMECWTLHNAYDRPIPRRIVEEAGVPRKAFGVRKKNTSHEAPFLWPYSPGCQTSFTRYLKTRGVRALSPLSVSIIRRIATFENLVYMNVMKKLGLKKRFRPWQRLVGPSLLFQWANHELKQLYQKGLQEASAHGQVASECGPLPR